MRRIGLLVAVAGCGAFPRLPSVGGDGGGDTGGGSWSFAPVNFDPTDPYIAAGGPDWMVLVDNKYDTDMPPPAGTPPVMDTALARVIRIGTLTIPAGVSYQFTGSKPVILVADVADIAGELVASSGALGASRAPCTIAVPLGGMLDSSGGAGGAFGGAGGDGGHYSGMNTMTAGQAANGDSSLEPLRGGCAGGNGLLVITQAGGVGGAGGGALQLTVRNKLTFTGKLLASGFGGRGGGTYTGGGGGGAGGGILVEGDVLVLSGSICAEGGGGAEGSNGSNTPVPGKDGCTPGVIANGGSGTSGFDGGNGGRGTALDGSPAQPDTSLNTAAGQGGGGGGGAVGRIRMRARTFQGTSQTYSPSPPRVDNL